MNMPQLHITDFTEYCEPKSRYTANQDYWFETHNGRSCFLKRNDIVWMGPPMSLEEAWLELSGVLLEYGVLCTPLKTASVLTSYGLPTDVMAGP